MLNRIKQWLAPPVFEDESKTRSAALLNGLLLMLLAANVLGTAIILPLEPEEWVFNSVFGVLLTLLFLWFRRLVHRGKLRGVSYVLALVLWLSMTVLVLMGQGVRDSSVAGYFLVITLASLLLGGSGVWLFGLMSAMALTAMFLAEVFGLLVFTPAVSVRIADWMVINLVLLLTALLLRSAMNSLDSTVTRLREKEVALAESNRTLQEKSAGLTARTQELEHRTKQLQVITELGRVTATLRDQDALCIIVPGLIGKRLALNYVGLFLIGEARTQLVLRGGYSSSGKDLSLGREVMLQEYDVLTQTATSSRAHLLIDEDDAAFPETRSRLVLPVMSGERVLGVLDLHSAAVAAFDEQDAAALQGMADQLGVALDNVALLVETQAALESAQRAYGQISSRAWAEMARGAALPGFRSREYDILPVDARLSPEVARALREKQMVHVPGNAEKDHLLVLPIKIRDTVIGAVDTYKPGQAEGWTEPEIALLQELAEQLGVALESARLYQDTQRRAAREQLTGEIAGRIRQSLNFERVLQTAAREFGDVLNASEVNIRLVSGQSDELRKG